MATGPTIVAKFIADTARMTDEIQKASSGGLSSLKNFAKTAAVVLGGAFAVTSIVDFTKAAVQSAEASEKAQAKLAVTLRNVTGATDAQVKSSENFISSLSRQVAISKGELRPAFDNLVRGFGNAEDAQKALALATDISVGTGKDLESVTLALQKAANGSTSGLQRLGIETKNADGSAKSLTQIMSDLSTMFSGQAAAAADTTAGKMKLAELSFNSLRTTVGVLLLPVIAFLADFMSGTLVPAIQNFFSFVGQSDAWVNFVAFIQGTVIPALQALGAWFMAVVVPAVSDFITGTLVPAFQTAADWVGRIAAPAVAEFFTNTLVPALQSAADWIGQVAAPAAADFFTNTLVPAIKDTASWIRDTLIPAFQEAKDAVAESGAFQAFVAGLEGLGKISFAGLQTAVGLIKDDLIPAFVTMAQTVNDNKDVVVSALGAVVVMLVATNLGFISLIPTAVGLFGIWVAGALSAAAATALAALPFVLIGIAIAALILIVIRNWDTIVNATKVAFDFVMNIIGGVISWIGEHWQALLILLTGPIGVAIAIIVANWDTIKNAFLAVWSFITDQWSQFVERVAGPVKLAVTLVIAYWALIIAGIMLVWDFITTVWSTVVDLLAGPVQLAVNLIIGYYSLIWQGIQIVWDIIQNIWSAITDVLAGPVQIAVVLITGYWNLISAGAQILWDFLVTAWNGISGAISTAVGVIGGVINTFVNFLRLPIAAATEMFNWVKDKFQQLADFLGGIVSGIASTMSRVADAIKGPINAVIRAWNQLGFQVPRIDVPKIETPLGTFGGGSFGGFRIDFPKIPELAGGGVLTDPTLFVGGESGTEIVAPESLLRTIVAEESGSQYILNMYPRTADAADIAYGFRRLELMAGLP